MTDLTREQATLITASLLMLASVAAAATLMFAQSVLIPFVLALMVSVLVMPLVDGLQTRLRAPRRAAIIAAFLAIGVGWVLLSLLIYTSALGLRDNAEAYRARIASLGEWAVSVLELIPPELRPDGWNVDDLSPHIVLERLDLDPLVGTLASSVTDVAAVLATLFSNGVLVLLFSVILISGRAPYEERHGLLGTVEAKVRTYLGTKFLMSAMTGLGTAALLWLLGLDLAIVFGLLAFLLNFIPSIGSIVATVLPIPIALMQFDSAGAILAAILLPGMVQFSIGNVLEPMVVGESLDLHPITVLLTLIFWGLLWGPVGMLLSTPITVVIKIVMEQFATTRPVADLLAGRLDLPDTDPPGASPS